MSIKSACARLISAAVGAGLAMSCVVAVPTAPQAQATTPLAATVAKAEVMSVPTACQGATSAYGKAVADATKARSAAAKAVKKAKKSRFVNRQNKKTSKRYTAAKSHRKLITNVSFALRKSRAKSLRTSTACTTMSDATRLTSVAEKTAANTKKLAAATSKLNRSVSLFSPSKRTTVRTSAVKTTVLANGFVYKSWTAKQWHCQRFSSTGGSWQSCRWVAITQSNDVAYGQCVNKDGSGTTTFRASKGWNARNVKAGMAKDCPK